MKILILIGTSDSRGTSVKITSMIEAKLSERYPDAELVTRQAFANSIRPCVNCGACKRKGKCTLRDEFDVWVDDMTSADLIFFIFPVYFFGIPAQFKAFIDRFHACPDRLREAGSRIAPVIISADTDPHVIDSVTLQLRQIADYLQWNLLPELWLGGLQKSIHVTEETNALAAQWVEEISL